MTPRIVLASGSPRRSDLLRQMGLEFTVRPTDADETLPHGVEAGEGAALLAERKARAALALDADALIIAADTLVAVDGHALGKPVDEADAHRMLRMLSARTHEVVTGLCVAYRGRLLRAVERTQVRFDALTDGEIDGYIATGEPMDKAGAYGIQGRAGMYINGIAGCYYNVMGLPLARLRKLLAEATGEEEETGLRG